MRGKCHFKKTRRLLHAFEFKAVFDSNQFRASNQHLLILARPRSLAHTKNSRLGLVVSKKVLPLAARRNRFKRVTREVFRKRFCRSNTGGMDLLVIARKGLTNIDNNELAETLSQLFTRIEKQADRDDQKNIK